jgi:hypothetical protein
MKILDDIPCAEAANGLESYTPVHNSRAAREGGIVGIFSGLHDIIKDGIGIAERISLRNFEELFRLDEAYVGILEVT